MPELRKLLRDETSDQAIDAAFAVWRITGETKESLEVLTSMLDQRRHRLNAMTALTQMGKRARSAAPAVIALKPLIGLDQIDPSLIDLTLWHIGHRQDQAMESIARELASGKLPWLVDEVAKIGPPAKPCLPALGAYKKFGVRLNAAFARCRIGGCDTDSLAILAQGLERKPEHAVSAARWLAQLGRAAKAASPALVRALERDEFEVYQAVVPALNAVDPEAAARAGVLLNPPRVRHKLARAEFAALWRDMTGSDPAKTLLAQWQLADTSGEAIAWFDEFLPAVKPVAPERLRQFLDDLKSEQFTVREEASRQIRALGELAETALRRSIESGGSLDFTRRVRKLLDELAPEAPRRQMVTRIIWSLEFHDTPEAARLLERWSRGHADSWRTQEAGQARQRIGKRASDTDPR